MNKLYMVAGAALLTLSLTACGGTQQADNNLAADDLNVVLNADEVAPMDPAPDNAVNAAAAEVAEPESPAPATTPAPAAKPAPAKPKAAEPKAVEPVAADPACPPEHRAAGHC